MPKKIKIAFDLDGVIIDKPPLIPKSLMEKLFKGFFESKKLHYRFPKSKIEQIIRKISHFYLFRPPIKQNIEFIKKIAKNKKYELYIISGRYSFLEKETKIWLKKRGLSKIFRSIYLNLNNQQPHLFKEETLKKIKPDIFIDDDCLLADYLVEKRASGKIYCFSTNKTTQCNMAQLICFEEMEKLL